LLAIRLSILRRYAEFATPLHRDSLHRTVRQTVRP